MMGRVTRRTFVGRDVGVAFGILTALVVLMAITSVRVLQIPGYLLVIAYDAAQNLWLPGLNPAVYVVGFTLYVYVAALLIATLYRGLRHATHHDTH